MVMNRISTVMISGMMALSRKPAPRKAEYRRMGVGPTRLTTNRAIRRESLVLSIRNGPISIPHMDSHGMGVVQPTKATSGAQTPMMI